MICLKDVYIIHSLHLFACDHVTGHVEIKIHHDNVNLHVTISHVEVNMIMIMLTSL